MTQRMASLRQRWGESWGPAFFILLAMGGTVLAAYIPQSAAGVVALTRAAPCAADDTSDDCYRDVPATVDSTSVEGRGLMLEVTLYSSGDDALGQRASGRQVHLVAGEMLGIDNGMPVQARVWRDDVVSLSSPSGESRQTTSHPFQKLLLYAGIGPVSASYTVNIIVNLLLPAGGRRAARRGLAVRLTRRRVLSERAKRALDRLERATNIALVASGGVILLVVCFVVGRWLNSWLLGAALVGVPMLCYVVVRLRRRTKDRQRREFEEALQPTATGTSDTEGHGRAAS